MMWMHGVTWMLKPNESFTFIAIIHHLPGDLYMDISVVSSISFRIDVHWIFSANSIVLPNL